MTVNELRIGNYIQFNNGKLWQVGPNDFELVSMPNFEPIPITKKWLVRFGAYAHDSNKNWLYIDIIKSESSIFYSFDYDSGCSLLVNDQDIKMDKIKYIHQLQNLYFFLTSQELAFKSRKHQMYS